MVGVLIQTNANALVLGALDILCWLRGGCTGGPSPAGSAVGARAEHLARAAALICYLCLSRACFHGARGDFFPLPLCQTCFGRPGRRETRRAEPARRPAGDAVGHGSSANGAEAKPLRSAVQPFRFFLFRFLGCFFFPRGILCSSQNPKAIGNAEG